MADEWSEFQDLYVSTAREYVKSLNDSLLKLEKNPQDEEAIEEIFRSSHSLKGQSAVMKYDSTAYLCHTVEDIFYEIRKKRMQLNPQVADLLFTAFDSLEKAIDEIEREKKDVDHTEIINNLKKLTGVKTEGGGKSTGRDEGVQSEVKTKKITESSKGKEKQAIDSDTNNKNQIDELKIIPVRVEKIDEVMNIMGEVLIQRLRLAGTLKKIDNPEFRDFFSQMEKNLDNLQRKIMKMRTLPIKFAFDFLPRAARDLARKQGKEVDVVIEGENIELDRTIVERLEEPLVHILRNSIDHGIEKKGTIKVRAARQGEFAEVRIEDTGKGIDWQKISKISNIPMSEKNKLKDALFSGISTSEKITEVSGRGIGLKAVKKNVEDFNGSLDVISQGHGTTFILRFPLTLAIIKTLIIESVSQSFAIPTGVIERTIDIDRSFIKKNADQEVFVLDDEDVPLIRLDEKLNLKDLKNQTKREKKEELVVIVKIGDEKIGLAVDNIVEVTDTLLKPVPDILRGSNIFFGTTILSNGKSALIISPEGILEKGGAN
ncbi:MAG: chemotaxis protein CheW [Candidatus Levybacteria bacterium]|nr:chemotaxis protein CheW [Candidatus Levybacteria bacterium]